MSTPRKPATNDVLYMFSNYNNADINTLQGFVNWVMNLDAPAYKVYSAWISQSGTDAPTVTVLENKIGEIVWTRDQAGNYYGTLAGVFPEEKTLCFTTSILSAVSPVPEYYSLIRYDDDSVFVESGTLAVVTPGLDPAKFVAVAADDILFEATIEIRVYN